MNLPAAMFTASHNPASIQRNQILSSRCKRYQSLDTGLAAIRDRAKVYLAEGIPEVDEPGSFSSKKDVLAEYATYLRHFG